MITSDIAIIAIIILVTYIIIVKIKRRNKIVKLPTIKKRSVLECNNISKNCTVIDE